MFLRPTSATSVHLLLLHLKRVTLSEQVRAVVLFGVCGSSASLTGCCHQRVQPIFQGEGCLHHFRLYVTLLLLRIFNVIIFVSAARLRCRYALFFACCDNQAATSAAAPNAFDSVLLNHLLSTGHESWDTILLNGHHQQHRLHIDRILTATMFACARAGHWQLVMQMFREEQKRTKSASASTLIIETPLPPFAYALAMRALTSINQSKVVVFACARALVCVVIKMEAYMFHVVTCPNLRRIRKLWPYGTKFQHCMRLASILLSSVQERLPLAHKFQLPNISIRQ